MGMTRNLLLFIALVGSIGGCGGSDDEGDCSGSVLDCSWAELSGDQEQEACDLITASIESPAGTKYECTQSGLSLTVENASTCVSHSYAAGCPVTVRETLDCYKAAKADACAAFEDSGACGQLFAAVEDCQ